MVARKQGEKTGANDLLLYFEQTVCAYTHIVCYIIAQVWMHCCILNIFVQINMIAHTYVYDVAQLRMYVRI